MGSRVVCQAATIMQDCGQLRSHMLGEVLEDVGQAGKQICQQLWMSICPCTCSHTVLSLGARSANVNVGSRAAADACGAWLKAT